MAAALITLTTDFGLRDPYVAAMKGVIHSINPEVTVVDVTHDVAPQCVEQGAFLLGCAGPYFPRGAIHVAVIDPGVGTDRRALAVVTEVATYIGPDNGVLASALPDSAREAARGGPKTLRLQAGVHAYELNESRFHRTPVSATFHGRDVFAPVAAHLSLGVSPSELGTEIQEMVALPPFRAEAGEAGVLRGRVVHIDRFGNAITSVRGEQLPSSELVVEAAGRSMRWLAQTYADADDIIALVGSWGFLEIARNAGHAANELGLKLGDAVSVKGA